MNLALYHSLDSRGIVGLLRGSVTSVYRAVYNGRMERERWVSVAIYGGMQDLIPCKQGFQSWQTKLYMWSCVIYVGRNPVSFSPSLCCAIRTGTACAKTQARLV